MAGRARDLKLKAKTRQEMASEYGIDRKTFYYWLKRANLPISSGLIYPAEVMLIYETFGDPGYSNKYTTKNN